MNTLSSRRHAERHRIDRIGWLRAAVLGANDGILSTSSLLAGVAAANAGHASLLMYVARGLRPELAAQVAAQLMAHDALGAHARDELGISASLGAKPIQAALASAASFSMGALLPLVVAVLAPSGQALYWIMGTSLACLAVLGALSARAGGAGVAASVTRVVVWGVIAMATTAGVGMFLDGIN